jgi:hypothetical protein
VSPFVCVLSSQRILIRGCIGRERI